MYEGPRGATPEDAASLKALVGLVFRPTLYEEYPQLFHPGNLPNCRIMLHEGQVISHVGMTIQDALLLGCRVRVACIGGVATHPEHRGHGCATRLFADAGEVAYRAGVDFMIISGDRGLYRRAGCRRVGRDFDVRISREEAARWEDATLQVEKVDASAIPIIARLYALEPVRFERTRDDYERAFACSFVMNRPADFLLIRRGQEPLAYGIVQHPREPQPHRQIAEVAGDRRAFLGSAAQILDRYQAEALTFHVGGWDRLTYHLCQQAGLTLRESHASGTVRVVHFQQLMDRMRPYLEQRLGEAVVENLSFGGNEITGYEIRYADEVVSVPTRGDLAHLVFGTRETTSEDPLARPGRLPQLLREVFPLPALWYGINYV